jgi:hypothetical protein
VQGQILDERQRRGNLQYLVCWKGYRREHDTWEAVTNLENAAEVVQDFYKQGPDVLISAMKIRAVAFKAFNHHPCLSHPLTSSAGEGFVIPDWHHSQHDWMLTVTLGFINRMVGGLQDRWQDQVLGGVDRIWLAKPADNSPRRREWKVEYMVILGQDDYLA